MFHWGWTEQWKGWEGQIWLPWEENPFKVACHIQKKKIVMFYFVCALWTECGLSLTYTHQVIWLLASLSRHHIEAQQECVTDPHSEREGWQDGYRNMHWVSCVLNGHEKAQCIFLMNHPLNSPLCLFNWVELSLLLLYFSFRSIISVSLLFSQELWRGSLIGWGDRRVELSRFSVALTDPKIK